MQLLGPTGVAVSGAGTQRFIVVTDLNHDIPDAKLSQASPRLQQLRACRG